MTPIHWHRIFSSTGRNLFGPSAGRRSVVLACALLLGACVEDDPRYPAYYSYAVDVKVDGQPIRIERVIKCTGTLVTDWSVSPGTKTGATYNNPPLIGAYVPGTRQAVYAPVVNACLWVAPSNPDSVDPAPFTPENTYLPPDSKLPVLWVSDDETFDQMEYYVSARALSGQDSHVEFIKVYPPEISDEAAFVASEKRAETESPDLTPFFFPRDKKYARGTKLYNERFGENYRGLVVPFCFAAWRIPRAEWSLVPGLAAWVAELQDDGRAYVIDSELWGLFNATIPINQKRSIAPVEGPDVDIETTFSRLTSYDAIDPVISSDVGKFVDFSRQGFFGCNYDVIHPKRVDIALTRSVDRTTKPTASYPVELKDNQLYAELNPIGSLVYVRQLDEFIVYFDLVVGRSTIDEPVVKGWKE